LVCKDVWYIIPEKETRGKWSISLGTQCAESRYEKYLEAWDLLRRPEFNGDIQACAEEFPTLLGGHDPIQLSDALQLGALMGSGRCVEPHIAFSGD
jgi:hypothetical protein